MAVPMLDLTRLHGELMPALVEAFRETAASGRYVLGPKVDAFETELAAYCGVPHAVGVSSGTDALLVALMAIGLRPGDEVITTPFTFIATATCIARLGGTPVFVDIQQDGFNIDPDQIERAITPKTRAIIPVHLFGEAADMKPIMEIGRARGIKVIEDAAQALGASDHGTRVGAIGDIGCLSFYPTKNLPALGDAGACTTADPGLAERLRELRVHGQTSRYRHGHLGGNFRIDALQAAMLSVGLPLVDGWNDWRRRAAGRYRDLLADQPITLPSEQPEKVHSYGQYTVRVPGDQRDALRAHLGDKGIGSEVYYPTPLHLQPCFSGLNQPAGRFPEAELASREVLSLPMFPGISEDEQQQVAEGLSGFFEQGG